MGALHLAKFQRLELRVRMEILNAAESLVVRLPTPALGLHPMLIPHKALQRHFTLF